MVFAMWGGARESRGLWDTFRMAAADDEPPYLVTETERGACKQTGAVRGFYTAAGQEDGASVWQAALTPVVLWHLWYSPGSALWGRAGERTSF